MASQAIKEATEETKMELTPMIDVTFLLLIFFLCSIKFKILEGKLQTYLPKDVGVNASPVDKMLEKIDLRIERRDQRDTLNLDDIEVFKKWKTRGWAVEEVKITLQGETMESLDQLQRALEDLRERVPAPTDPDEEDELKMNIEAMKGAIYEDVVKVVDVAIGAGFTSITFRGIEMDA